MLAFIIFHGDKTKQQRDGRGQVWVGVGSWWWWKWGRVGGCPRWAWGDKVGHSGVASLSVCASCLAKTANLDVDPGVALCFRQAVVLSVSECFYMRGRCSLATAWSHPFPVPLGHRDKHFDHPHPGVVGVIVVWPEKKQHISDLCLTAFIVRHHFSDLWPSLWILCPPLAWHPLLWLWRTGDCGIPLRSNEWWGFFDS